MGACTSKEDAPENIKENDQKEAPGAAQVVKVDGVEDNPANTGAPSGNGSNLAKVVQAETKKVNSDERVFLDTPLKLPDEIPGLNRDKSVWVLGPNKKEAKAPIEEYKFERRLGSPGQFGEAWRATRKRDGKQVAVKKIAKARFMNDPKRAQKYLNVFSAEIQIMQRLDHKYCIKFFEAFEDSNYLYMAMELCTGGELFDRIVAKKKHTEHEAAKTLKMLFEGLAYIHHHGLAHCDLKPDNFLFENPSEDSPIKIIDFGMAKPVPPHEYHNSFCGTPYYVAPEVLKQQGYNQSCDLWSMGVIMFLMIFGFPPFHSARKKENDAGHREIFRKIRNGFHPIIRSGFGPWFPSNIPVSQDAKDLMAALMEMDTSKRITADEALHHPWFKKAMNLDTAIDDRVLKSLKDFRKTGKFKQMLLSSLVAHIDEKESAALEKTLRELDLDGSGYIEINELKEAFKGTLAQSDVVKIAEAADIKGDEVISIEELTMVWLDRKVSQKEERLWQAFTKLDKTGNMNLSLDDIRKGLEEVKGLSWDAEEIEDAFKEADLDGNGHIDYDEFLYLWGSKVAPPRPASHAYRVMSSSFSTGRPQPVDNPVSPEEKSSASLREHRPAKKSNTSTPAVSPTPNKNL